MKKITFWFLRKFIRSCQAQFSKNFLFDFENDQFDKSFSF